MPDPVPWKPPAGLAQVRHGRDDTATHDEDLMDAVATRVWHFDHEGVHDFKGSYEEFAEELAAK